MRIVGAVRLHSMTARIKITSRNDILCVKDLDELITAHPCFRLVDFKHDVLVIVFLGLRKRNQLHSRNICQPFPIAIIILLICLDEVDQTFH